MMMKQKQQSKAVFRFCEHRLLFRYLLLCTALLLCLVFSGCSGKKAEESASSPEAEPETEVSTKQESTAAALETAPSSTAEIVVFSETDEEETQPETAAAALLQTEAPPEEGLVRSPLTNEWVTKEQAAKRPVAVMYPTDKKAQPQYGLDRVSVFYEIMEEGSMSRQMGLLENWEDLERIGNVRSTRDYFIIESMEWDSILVHFGGPEIFVRDLLTRDDVDNINGVGGVMGSDYGAFYRIPAGSKSEHTAYTDGEHLAAAIEKAGFETEHREGYWQDDRWKFASALYPVDLSADPSVTDALEIDMSGCFPITKSTFSYNEEDGLYYRSIYGSAQKDAVTGEQMAFRNILIESCTSGDRGAGYLYFHVLDAGHEGYFLTGGKMIHCTWKKTTEYEPTRFYNDAGEEIVLNTGKTMVCIGRSGDSFTADGVQYGL